MSIKIPSKEAFLHNISPGQTILKNTFWVFLAEVFISGSRFVIQILLARKLGVDGFGLYSFIISFAAFFQVIAGFGIPVLVVREVSKNKNKVADLLHHGFIVKALLSIVTLVLIYGASHFYIEDKTSLSLIYLAVIFLILNTFCEFLRAFFRAFEKMELETLSKGVEGLLSITLVGAVAIFLPNLKTIFLSFIIVSGLTGIISFLILKFQLLKKAILFPVKTNWGRVKGMLNESKFLAVAGLGFVLYSYSDQLIINFFHGDTATGYYGVAYQIIILGVLLSGVIRNALDPFLSKNQDYKKVIKLRNYTTIAGIALFLIVFFLSPYFTVLLFGKNYEKSAIITQILSFTYLPMFFNISLGNLIIMKGKQKMYACLLFSSLLFNVALNIIFVPRYSYLAAAVSTVLAELLLAVLFYAYIAKKKHNLFSSV